MNSHVSGGRSESQSTIQQFNSFATSHISDAMSRTGCMRDIFPVCRGVRMLGKAFTVMCPPNDNLMVHYGVKFAQKGDVLVVSTSGHPSAAPWGELLSISAKQRGLAGVVIDGCTRDRAEVEALGFPVYVRGVIPKGCFKMGGGSVNKPICCGGSVICCGDIIVGDDDGVVVIPWQSVGEVLRECQKIVKKECEMRSRVLEGEVLYDFLHLDEVLAQSSRKMIPTDRRRVSKTKVNSGRSARGGGS